MANNNENQSKTYKQQAGEFYNRQYDSWVPWMEDKYLAWFTKDNKASYATKRTSSLTHLTYSVLPTTLLPSHPILHFHTTTHDLQRISTRPNSQATSKSTQRKTASTAS
jgi:uncharacterized membrane protein YkvA (DUF1232 family)